MKYPKLDYVPPRILTKKIFFKLVSMWRLLFMIAATTCWTFRLSSRFSYVTFSCLLSFLFACLYLSPSSKRFYARASFQEEVRREGGFRMLVQAFVVLWCITWLATLAVVTGWTYFNNPVLH